MSSEAQKRMLLSLGLPEDGITEMRKGEPSEPVDIDRIREFYRGNLNTGDAIDVSYLLSHEEAWFSAGNKVLLERVEEANSNDEKTSLPDAKIWRSLQQQHIVLGIAATLLIALGSFLWLFPRSSGFNDGEYFIALRDGTITGLDGFGPEWASLAQSALIDGQLPKPENTQELVAGLRMKRGAPRSNAIVAPYLSMVHEQSPLFQWRAIGNPLGYRVVIKDAHTLEVLSSNEIEPSSTEFELADELARGRLYIWEVEYQYADRKSKAPKADDAPARFFVMSAESVLQLKAEEANISDSRFLRFLLYVREGLFEEAEGMLEELKGINGDSKYLNTLSKLLRQKRNTLIELQNDKDAPADQL